MTRVTPASRRQPAPWTRLVLQKLVRFPPLPKEQMVLLRRCLQKHREWRVAQEEMGDAHYITDVRSPRSSQLEKSVQERILEALRIRSCKRIVL